MDIAGLAANMQSMKLQQAVQLTMAKKVMDQQQQTGDALTQMMADAAKISGQGQSVDIKG